MTMRVRVLMFWLAACWLVCGWARAAEWDLSDYSGFAGVADTYTEEYPAQDSSNGFPEFSWSTVPRWLAVRSNVRFSEEQVDSLASNYQIVMLEKANSQGFDTIEEGIIDAATRIKALDASTKTLFYWNARINYGGYAANDEYDENQWEWSTHTTDTNGTEVVYWFKDLYCWYDFSSEGLRDWWAKIPYQMATNDVIDGVFIDAIAKTPGEDEGALYDADGLPATDFMRMADALAQSLPDGKLLMGNTLRNEKANGNRTHMTYFDGSYLERWDITMKSISPTQSTADAIAMSMQLMREALFKGKIVNLQSGPPDGDDSTMEHMEEHLDFPLAVFLVVAETNAYFSYQGSVDATKDSWLWDSSWMDELSRPVGRPLCDPIKNGYIYARSYEYVDVWVDISTEEAILSWRTTPASASVLGSDDFDGGGVYASRTFSDTVNDEIAGFGALARSEVLSGAILDSSAFLADGSAGDGVDEIGFLESTKTDAFLAINRAGSRTLTYAFDVGGYKNLNLSADWISGDNYLSTITVSASVDGGATNEIFSVIKNTTDWTPTMEAGNTASAFANSAEVFTNGVSAGVLGDSWTNLAASISASGSVLSVTVAQSSNYSGALGLDNLVLTGELDESLQLIAHWPLNESAGGADISGNGFHGVLSNEFWCAGLIDGALSFNGSNTMVSIPAEAFDSISEELSIAMWVLGDASQPLQDSVFYAEDASSNRVLNIHLPWSNSNVYWDAGFSGEYDRIYQAAEESDFKGQWNHWVFTKDALAGQMSIYLNGALWHSDTEKNIAIAGITRAVIGMTSNDEGYFGSLSDVRLYASALTDAEVASLYEGFVLTNGVPLAWLSSCGVARTTDVALDDADSDGLLNWQEYIAGLDPTNYDGFAVTSGSDGLEWNAADGRVYDVYWSSNLVDGFSLMQSNVVGGVFNYSVPAEQSRGFYKIKVGLPE